MTVLFPGFTKIDQARQFFGDLFYLELMLQWYGVRQMVSPSHFKNSLLPLMSRDDHVTCPVPGLPRILVSLFFLRSELGLCLGFDQHCRCWNQHSTPWNWLQNSFSDVPLRRDAVSANHIGLNNDKNVLPRTTSCPRVTITMFLIAVLKMFFFLPFPVFFPPFWRFFLSYLFFIFCHLKSLNLLLQ